VTDRSPLSIGPLTPFLCEYDGPDGRYSIMLYGTDEKQVLEEHCAELPGLSIEGVVYERISASEGGKP
jgi:hypothetical protein